MSTGRSEGHVGADENASFHESMPRTGMKVSAICRYQATLRVRAVRNASFVLRSAESKTAGRPSGTNAAPVIGAFEVVSN